MYLGFINLRMRMLHCYLKAETKTSPAACILRNWHSACFGELTYGFIFLNFCGCASKDCLEIQSRWFYCNSFSSIGYQYYRIYDVIDYGKESPFASRLEVGCILTSNAFGLIISLSLAKL